MSAKDSAMFNEAIIRKISGVMNNDLRDHKRTVELEIANDLMKSDYEKHLEREAATAVEHTRNKSGLSHNNLDKISESSAN